MKGILGRLASRPKPLAVAERRRLVVVAVQMHREGARTSTVEQHLVEQGLAHETAREVCSEARLDFESEASRDVALPASARQAINYYFALGVTPQASPERIHRAFRQRAREVHPDRHNGELNHELWGQLMTIASDAHTVLLDQQLRRAYDVFWLRRSRRATAEFATARERRGDWGTRYHWYMAEVAEIEDNLDAIVQDVRGRLQAGQVLDEPLSALESATDLYEERILDVRTSALSVPATHRRLADRARLELVRKDRLVAILRDLPPRLPRGDYTVAEGTTGLERIAATVVTGTEVHAAHRRFELEAMREAAA